MISLQILHSLLCLHLIGAHLALCKRQAAAMHRLILAALLLFVCLASGGTFSSSFIKELTATDFKKAVLGTDVGVHQYREKKQLKVRK